MLMSKALQIDRAEPETAAAEPGLGEKSQGPGAPARHACCTMAGLKAAIVALALTTASGFAPAAPKTAARGRPSLKSYWRLHLDCFQRADAAARHHFVQMKLCARLRCAGCRVEVPRRRRAPCLAGGAATA